MTDPTTAPTDSVVRSDEGVVDRLRTQVPFTRPADLPAVNVISNYSLAGVDWEYYRVFYRILGLSQNWPDGLTGHVAWQGKDAWRSFYLWDDEHTADAYFAEVGIDTVTNTIRSMGVAKGPSGVTDVVPRRLAIEDWILGGSVKAFEGIGEDRDGSSIDVLATRPVIAELELKSRAKAVARALGFEREIPRDLLALVIAEVDGACQLLLIWTDEEIARAALETRILPALKKAGIEYEDDAVDSICELRLLSFAEGSAAAFGHAPAKRT